MQMQTHMYSQSIAANVFIIFYLIVCLMPDCQKQSGLSTHPARLSFCLLTNLLESVCERTQVLISIAVYHRQYQLLQKSCESLITYSALLVIQEKKTYGTKRVESEVIF